MIKKLKLTSCSFYLFLFVCFFVFFSQAHPLLPFDTDDWTYLSRIRQPYPSFSQWNPTKFLPEFLEPLMGLIAGYIVTPIVGDYINAIVYTNAFIVTCFIIGYLYSLEVLLERKFHINKYTNFCIIIIFTLLHFLALKSGETNNEHLWYSRDVNCYYNYIIPNMLCAGLVMWLMTHNYRNLKSTTSITILAFITYLALFSNLYSTVILIAYIGAILLFDLWNFNKKQSNWVLQYFKHHAYFLIILFVWLIVQFFEANGKRATTYGYMFVPFMDSLMETIKDVLFKTHLNIWFLLFSFGSIVCAKIYDYKYSNPRILHIGKQYKALIVAMFLSISYLIILSSRVFPYYMLKGDVIFAYLFFLLLLVAMAMAYLCARIRLARILCPFVILFIFFKINSQQKTFKDLHEWHQTDIYTCEEFDRDVINQVKVAEEVGMDTVIIYVHNYNEDNNWPLNLGNGQCMGFTLHKHGITKREMITIFERMPKEIDIQ